MYRTWQAAEAMGGLFAQLVAQGFEWYQEHPMELFVPGDEIDLSLVD